MSGYKHNSQESWKANFAEVLRNYMLAHTGVLLTEHTEIFEAASSAIQRGHRYIWAQLGRELNIPARVIHDYFYNTWSKRFYDNLVPYREELIQIYNYGAYGGDKKERIITAIDIFRRKHPRLRVHVQSTYSYLYGLCLA